MNLQEYNKLEASLSELEHTAGVLDAQIAECERRHEIEVEQLRDQYNAASRAASELRNLVRLIRKGATS